MLKNGDRVMCIDISDTYLSTKIVYTITNFDTNIMSNTFFLTSLLEAPQQHQFCISRFICIKELRKQKLNKINYVQTR